MTTTVIILLILLVYWKIKNQYGERVTLEFQYKLYDLRDKLRDCALSGRIDKNDWRFRYLDGSISKTVNELESVNLYSIILMSARYKKDRNFLVHKSKITKAIKEQKYAELFHEQYGELLARYVFKKHFLIRSAYMFHLISSIVSRNITKRLVSYFRKASGNVRFAPETSIAYDYC